MKVGLSAIITPKDWPFAELVRQARTAGYEVLEVVPREGGELTLDTPEAELDALTRIAADEGIDIVALCGSGGRPFNLMTTDEGERRAGIETTKAMLRTARALGADTVLHTLGGRPTAELFYDDAYANALRALQELAPTAEDLGVSIAVEYVWNGFLTSPMEMARFLDEVGSRAVGFYFDPGNMRIFHLSEHWARICGRHIKKVHAKDFSWEGRVVQWPPLLEGQVDFPAVMRELRGAGYDGPLISEVDPSVASLADSAAAIRRIIVM